MIPKTEKELELYFKLKELEDARNCRHKIPYGIGINLIDINYYELEYQRIKIEYLKLVADV